MKGTIKKLLLVLLIFYLLVLLNGGISLPGEKEVQQAAYLSRDQRLKPQLEEQIETFVTLEKAIDEQVDRLLFIEKIMDFIQDTNPQVENRERYLMATAAYREARRYNLDPLIIVAIMYQESRFKERAIGAHEEIGLMQVKPTTGEKVARQMKQEEYQLLDIHDNIALGTRYLIYCLNRTREYARSSHENIQYGLSAYNRGLGAVLRDLRIGNDPTNRYQREVLQIHTQIVQDYF